MANDMNIKQVLDELDKHASEFNFPVFDNAYVEFGASRLSAFRSEAAWLIVFEVLGFSMREVQFVDDIYAYGSCLDRQGLIAEELPFVAPPSEPFFDPETNDCIIDWSQWSVKVAGEIKRFSPTREDYKKAGINITEEPGQGSLKEIELLRYLVHMLGERLFLSSDQLLANVPRCTGLTLFLQSSNWQHPDVASEERPSQNVAIRSLVEALSSGDPLVFREGRPNTHWSFWDNAVE